MEQANLLDKAIGWVSPSAGLRRAKTRAALRGYDAVTKSRNRDPWYSRGTSADAEISRAGPALRDVMRDMVRNNPYAANAVHNLVTHAVGSGIVPRAKDPRVNKLFSKWASQCDAEGHLDFFGMQALIVRGMLESGDGLVRKRRRKADDGLAVPLQLQVLEPDNIDTSKTGTINGLEVFEGIGREGPGTPAREYWLYSRHPGAPNGTTLESFAVPASDIAHCFEKRRTQSRGEPWGVAAIPALRDLAEYEAAEIVRKKLESCVVGVVTSGAGEDGVSGLPLSAGEPVGVYNADGQIVERFEPGAFYHARGGRDIKFTQPAATGFYDSYKVSMLHTVAAGFRVPYALLSGNLSKVNYSSGKMGLETYKRTIEEIQWKIIIPMLLQPIWDWFCEAAYLAGKIRTRTVAVEWSPPRFPSADEAKDVVARVRAMRAGLLNPMTAIAETGYTPDEVLAGYVEWNKKLDEYGLIFDSDPRHVSQAGQMQEASDAAPEDDDRDSNKDD